MSSNSDIWNGGKIKASLSDQLAGEDLTNDVIKVEQRFSYAGLTSAGTVSIKSGAGFLHTFTLGTISCPTISIWDSTVPSGTLISRIGAGSPIQTFHYNVSFSTGLVLDAGSGGVVPHATVSYR